MRSSTAPGTEFRRLPRIGMLAAATVLAWSAFAPAQLPPLNAPRSDPSEPVPASPIPDETLSYRAYPLRHLDAETARQQLAEQLAAAPGLEVIIDNQKNRVLVRGNAQTHELVARLLANVDRPAVVEPAGGPAAGEARIVAYPLTEATRPLLLDWQRQTAGREDVRVAIDERTSQAVIYARPDVHAQIEHQLAQAGKMAPAANTSPRAALFNGLAPPAETITLQLRNLPASDLRPRLERLLSRQLAASADASGEWQGFAVEASPGVGVTMSVNLRTGQVRLDGPKQQVAAWRSVVEAMDTPPAALGSVTQLVATKPASHERVRKALQALQASGRADQTADASLVAALLQPREGAAQPVAPPARPLGQDLPSNAQTALEAAQIAEAAGTLLGPVQVEFVEGLDVIVIRGAERDVQRVMEIIEEIERLSEVTVPAIEIYELKNVDSIQLGALLSQLYAQTGVLGSRLGSVSITPLGKPNALLLIGRTENVQMAIDLAQRLDQPVAPFGRFEVFVLENASAIEAKTIVDGFLGQGEDQEAPEVPEDEAGQPIRTLVPRALVVADPRTNSLIVSASPRDLAEIAALITKIDRPGVAATLKVFEIKNGDAESLATTLRTLFGVTEEQAEQAGPGLAQGGPVRVQFSTDLRTNSIIAVGSQDDITVVEAILYRLDQGDVRERINTVYRLKNAYALDVANALNGMLQSERAVEVEAEIALSPFEQIEREVVIVPEIASNSLIVSATPRYYERIEDLIEDLDERPPMVLIQVLIAEVRLNDTDQFGVELGLQDRLLFDRSLVGTLTTIETTQSVPATGIQTTTQTIINAPGSPGFAFNDPATGVPLGNNLSDRSLLNAGNVAAQGLSNFALNRIDPTLGFSGFVFSASSDAVSVLLRALQENRRLEVLSRPQLMALDGQPGYVQVGQDVPTITGVSLTEFGQTNNILYRSVGLILRVVPRISPDGLVVMQILANKSEVGLEAEGIPITFSTTGVPIRAPRIEVTQAETTISALSGQTVVLGGLIQTRKSDVHRRVPIIADIPLIGDLFRYDSVQEERRELLIVMTPRIIYSKLDSDLVKQIESTRMSWCLADVVNVHGEAGLRSRCDEWYDGETEAVYPTYIPQEGELLPPPSGPAGPVLEMPVMEATPPSGSMPPAETLPVPASPDTPLPVPPPPAMPPADDLPMSGSARYAVPPAANRTPVAYGEAGTPSAVVVTGYAEPVRLPQSGQ